MPNATIYHNPRCSKSRQTLKLLQQRDIDPEVIEYLDNPPSEKTINQLLTKLGIEAGQLIRKKEYRELGLPDTDDSQQLVALMAKHPKIIERPIVVVGDKARLGRPPENVLEIL